MYLIVFSCIFDYRITKSPVVAGLKVTHTIMVYVLTQIKGMENLTVISGSNHDFVFIDHECDDLGLTAFFVPVELYNDGFYEDQSLIPVRVEYVSQGVERIVGGWESPIIEEAVIKPKSEYFDSEKAELAALEAAQEIIIQYEYSKV
ncbi:hypothetical protein B0I21_103279 [Sphingobacterium paludis]|uniref:Uncharacterized protein n=2 Tax=Sphingobacterium paludis TaxID=1476465 RepID=A0A4R7D1Z8_9SPHI|nr:hypothetical protein B0I21_103279 [Sphingobacterium paludis]